MCSRATRRHRSALRHSTPHRPAVPRPQYPRRPTPRLPASHPPACLCFVQEKGLTVQAATSVLLAFGIGCMFGGLGGGILGQRLYNRQKYVVPARPATVLLLPEALRTRPAAAHPLPQPPPGLRTEATRFITRPGAAPTQSALRVASVRAGDQGFLCDPHCQVLSE